MRCASGKAVPKNQLLPQMPVPVVVFAGPAESSSGESGAHGALPRCRRKPVSKFKGTDPDSRSKSGKS